MKPVVLFYLFLSLISQNAFCNPTIEDFLKEQHLINTVISPDGHYLAQLWNQDGARTVIVRDLLTPKQPIIGQLSDKITRVQAISWANKDRLIMTVWVPYDSSFAERMSTSKKDFDIDDYVAYSRLVATDANLKNGVILLNDKRALKGNTNLAQADYLPKDPSHVVMTAWDETHISLFKVNVYTGKSEKLIAAGDRTFAIISDDYGNPRYRLDYLPIAKEIVIFQKANGNDWARIDNIRLSNLEDDNALNEAELVSLSEEDLIYRKKNEETGYYELVKYNSKEKRIDTFVSLADQDVLSPINNTSKKIIGYTVDGDHLRHKYFSPDNQKIYDKLASKLNDYDFSISSKTDDLKTAVVNVSGADSPLSFYLYDFGLGDLKLIANAYTSITSPMLASSAIANYTARDGQKIRSYLLFPPNYQVGNKYPLIVMPHGGPQARAHANYDDFAQFLSTRGYVVIKPNFRGSTGYGKNFEQAGYKQWGQLMQDDIDDAVSFMIRKGHADPKKVCILGFSYGGYSALMGAAKRPDLYSCAVSINGVTHLTDMIENDKKEVDDDALFDKYWLQRIGNPTSDKAMLDANSPALLTDKISIPLLIIASEKDKIVPFSQAKTMTKALDKSKTKYSFVKLEDSGHNPFLNKKDTETVYREVDKFLTGQLK